MITQEEALRLFEYKDGVLYWKVATALRVKVGDKVGGGQTSHGYTNVQIKGKKYQQHRIIFLMHNGYMPEFIDHKDGDRLNNRIENLRQATRFENSRNAKLPVTNTSGVKGVSWNKEIQKYVVNVRIDGKKKYFGAYADLETASQVAVKARNDNHKEFANHG